MVDDGQGIATSGRSCVAMLPLWQLSDVFFLFFLKEIDGTRVWLECGDTGSVARISSLLVLSVCGQ